MHAHISSCVYIRYALLRFFTYMLLWHMSKTVLRILISILDLAACAPKASGSGFRVVSSG